MHCVRLLRLIYFACITFGICSMAFQWTYDGGVAALILGMIVRPFCSERRTPWLWFVAWGLIIVAYTIKRFRPDLPGLEAGTLALACALALYIEMRKGSVKRPANNPDAPSESN